MRIKALLICILMLVTALLSTASARQDRPAGTTGATPKAARQQASKPVDIIAGDVLDFVNRASHLLNLTDEQKTEIDRLVQDNRGILYHTHQSLQTAQKTLQTTVFAGDETGVENAAAALAAAARQHAQFQAAFMKSVRQTLTEEQIDKLEKMQLQFTQTQQPAGRRGTQGRRANR